MDNIHYELSSISIEKLSDLLQSDLEIITNEISSISEISISELIPAHQETEKPSSDIKTLRDKLIENVNVLENELEKFELNSKEGFVRNYSEEITGQLTWIHGQAMAMKEKLKTSEEVLLQKTQENSSLKQTLQELDTKVILPSSNCCHVCRIT